MDSVLITTSSRLQMFFLIWTSIRGGKKLGPALTHEGLDKGPRKKSPDKAHAHYFS